ncbi:MAG: efflux RND transporter periplasmic adaptor subunit [Candidatus Acidiferrales bacterium]
MAIKEYYGRHKGLVWLLAILLIVLITAGFYYRSHSTQVKYLTATVKRGDITSVVQATGTINPLTTVPVGSYVSGTVQYIFADFNTRVKANQVLAQLDPAIYGAQVINAQGNLDNAERNLQTLQATIGVDDAGLAKARANLGYVTANAKRTSDMYAQGIISQDQYQLTQSTLAQTNADVQAARAQLDQAKAQLNQARAQVEAQQGLLKQAETNLRYTTILSPIDGTVVARNVDVGQSVAAALQAPNVFTIAQDLTRMQVYAATDESDTGSIHVGQDVTFQVDAFPSDQFHGRVSAIRLNATTVQNVVTYATVIDFENPQEKLLPGETAYVTIPTGHASKTLEIPNAALTFTPDMASTDLRTLYQRYQIPPAAYTSHLGGWQVVWQLDAQKNLVPVAVRVGITDYVNSQLLEGNLAENSELITGQESASKTSTQGKMPGSPGAKGPGGPGPRR